MNVSSTPSLLDDHAPTHHPSTAQILAYCQGQMVTGKAVALSAHLESCPSCQARALTLEEYQASEYFPDSGETATSPVSADIADDNESSRATNQLGDSSPYNQLEVTAVVQSIIDRTQTQGAAVPASIEPNLRGVKLDVKSQIKLPEIPVKVNGLPSVLQKLISQGLQWKKLPGGVKVAPINLDRQTLCHFLYIPPGGRIPNHTHQGEEITLVLEGSFKDDMGSYGTGDFISLSEQNQHTPLSEESCLCFTVQDNPVIFCEGIAKLANPLQHWLFKRGII